MHFTLSNPQSEARNPQSDGEVLVRVENVGKIFCRDFKKSLFYGLQDSARDLFSWRKRASNQTINDQPSTINSSPGLRPGEFWANKDISFELRRGECLGLIGHNGAGKTTLLKMLNGLIKPDVGRIEMRGKVGALIALGAGFNPLLTGRENIYVNGSVLGLSREEIDAKIDEIIEFAEIREFIDAPVQTYSSGMQVRLGFAIATAMQPDVLIIDEVLAVGDIEFRAKCYDRLEKIRKDVAIILVSHNRQDISRMCNIGILLNKGSVGISGNVIDVMSSYESLYTNVNSFVRTHGDLQLIGTSINKNKIEAGDNLIVHVDILSKITLKGISFRMSIMDFSETALAEWRSEHHQDLINLTKGENKLTFQINNIRLRAGKYFCNFIFSKEGLGQYVILAFRIQELTIEGNVQGLCSYQL